MDVRDYLRLIARRWPTIVVFTLISIALSALLTVRATPEYASSAQLFVSTPQSDSNQAYQGGLFSQQRATSYARLLAGKEISKRVIDSLDLTMTPKELSSHVSASVIPETVILEATVRDSDPEQARLLAEELSRQFVSYIAELETPEGEDIAPIKVAVVDSASAPTTAVSPKPFLNLILGALFGAIIGLLAAISRELIDNSVKSPDDLQRIIKTPVLGTIPFDKDVPENPLITSLGTHHPRTEATRVLRTNLQFVEIDRDNQVIVITSSVPGEGKSTIVTNLAIALSQAGRRVALIEGDLRRPRISEYLGVEGSVGLTTVLIGRVELEDALQPAVTAGLDVLTSGALPPNPAEILQTKAMGDLLGYLRERYDIVLVDAPPLLPVTDGALLAAAADGVILIIRHGRTTHDQVRNAVERVESVGGKLLGAVLNMTPAKGGGSYGYGYGYGYGDDFPDAKPKTKGKKPKAKRNPKPTKEKRHPTAGRRTN